MYKILLCDTTLLSIFQDKTFGYEISVASNEDEIYTLTYEHKFDLYIVNFIYYELFFMLKKAEDITPTLFIDELYNIYNLKKSFEIGDDYIVKPIIEEEFLTRVDYQYKKLFNHKNNILVYNSFYYHITTQHLYKNSIKIKLTPAETKLLTLFLSHIDKPIAKDFIFDRLETTSDGTLRVYISKLNKLGFKINYQRINRTYTLEKGCLE